jgi:hypothetical protein
MGPRSPVATVKNGSLEIIDAQLYAEAIAKPAGYSDVVAGKTITRPLIDALTASLPADRAAKVKGVLEPYIGQTWKQALDAHSAKAAK